MTLRALDRFIASPENTATPSFHVLAILLEWLSRTRSEPRLSHNRCMIQRTIRPFIAEVRIIKRIMPHHLPPMGTHIGDFSPSPQFLRQRPILAPRHRLMVIQLGVRSPYHPVACLTHAQTI